MAISWGAWDYGSSSAGFRVGLEVTQSTVTTSSSSVTWTVKIYVEAMYNVNDEMTVSYSGNLSGSDTDNLTTGSSGGVKLWATKTYTYNYTTYGSSPGTRTFRADLSGVYNGANPYKSTTVTIPARPYAAPNAPTGVAAVRNTDAQATVSWTNSTTSQKPYTSLTVQRRAFTGGAWGAWSTVATTTAGATSYVATGLAANTAYQFQVRSNNSVGSSAYVATGTVWNTPAPPTGVSSVLNSTGASITTSWANAAYISGTVTFSVQRSVNGGAYANVQTGIAQGTTSWTDPSPGAGTNRYRVAAVQSNGPLTSAYTEGNTITTIVAPLAPTQLSPNGSAVDFAKAVTFRWKHNHGGDAAAQSHFTLEYSSNGGTTWTALANDVASTAESYTLAAGTLSNPGPYLWRVRTEGIVSGGYGPNSANATVTGSTTPTVTLTSPTDPVNTLPLVASWTYDQAQLSPQTAWEANLYEGGVLIQALSGNDASTSAQFSYPLVDGHTYTVAVRARSGAGIWSNSVSQAFTFSLLPPAPGSVLAEFQPATGTVVLSLSAAAAVPGTTVAADTVTVERRVNGGPWVVLATNLPIPNDFLDVLPITNGLNEYRVTTVSTSPSYNVGNPVGVTPPNPLTDPAAGDLQWVLVNFTDDFSALLRFRSEPDISETGGLTKALHEFAGRTRPVPAFGEAASRVVSVSGRLVHDPSGADSDGRDWDSPPEDWTLAGRIATVVCYRDFTGRRIFGTLGDVQVADDLPGLGAISFSVTEIDYEEPEGWVDRDSLPGVDFVVDGGDAYGTGSNTFDGGTA